MTTPPQATDLDTIDVARLPRISIQFCTQCKWMLRATYFSQELLSTFSTSIGEIALIPSVGGVFTVDITYLSSAPASQGENPAVGIEEDVSTRTRTTRLWDRKAEGGFPETKTLKQLVRNTIDPGRDLGHVDRRHGEEGKGRGEGG